jgi:ABC-type transporter Mla subunit MlaD
MIKLTVLKSVLGWATLGFFILWILEIGRVSFQESYWLVMLFVASLMTYAYVRHKIITESPKKSSKK